MWRILLLSFFLCLAAKHVEAKKPAGEDDAKICQREKLVKTEIGSTLRLKGFVDIGEECYFVFKPTDDNYECCYGYKDKKYCERSKTYEDKNERRCLNEKDYFVNMSETEKNTECVLEIKIISQSGTGRYIVYSNDDEEIQDCQVTVEKKETTPDIPLLVVKLLLGLFGSLGLGFLVFGGYWVLRLGKKLIIGYWLLVIGYWLFLVIGYCG